MDEDVEQRCPHFVSAVFQYLRQVQSSKYKLEATFTQRSSNTSAGNRSSSYQPVTLSIVAEKRAFVLTQRMRGHSCRLLFVSGEIHHWRLRVRPKRTRLSRPDHPVANQNRIWLQLGSANRFGSKADICTANRHVRCGPKVDMAHYSRTSSARKRKVAGIESPIALAAFRLITN